MRDLKPCIFLAQLVIFQTQVLYGVFPRSFRVFKLHLDPLTLSLLLDHVLLVNLFCLFVLFDLSCFHLAVAQ